MADYAELYDLLSDSALRNKIEMAIAEATRIIQAGEDTTDPPFSQSTTPIDYPTQRRKWARRVIGMEAAEARQLMRIILVSNKIFTKTQITNATDASIQANINNVIDLIAEGEV